MRKTYLFFLCFPLILFSQNQFKDAVDNFENKNFSKAEIQFKSIIKQNPDNLKAYEYLGDTYAAQEQWNNAIDVFENLVDKKPNNAEFNYKYGGSIGMKAKNSDKFTALFLLDDVKKYLKRSASLDPNHIGVRWALLELYLELPGVIGGSVSKAKDYASQLQNISPVDGALAYGRISDYKDNFESAEKYFKKAVAIGKSKTGYTKLIDLYVKYDKPEKALLITDEATQVVKGNDFNIKYAEIALQTNTKIQKGLKRIDEYIQSQNSSQYDLDKALVIKAKLHYNLGQVDEAKTYLRQALKHNPNSTQAKTELNRIEQL